MPPKAYEMMKTQISESGYSSNDYCITASLSTRYSDIQAQIDSLIKEVVFNDPYTIINWKSGTKTVVKAQEGDEFDKEKGFTLAVVKYINGNGGNYNNMIKKWCE